MTWSLHMYFTTTVMFIYTVTLKNLNHFWFCISLTENFSHTSSEISALEYVLCVTFVKYSTAYFKTIFAYISVHI